MSSLPTGRRSATSPSSRSFHIVDPARFEVVKQAPSRCQPSRSRPRLRLSRRVARPDSGLRIRHFEDVLGRGLLGVSTRGEYSTLANGDQGQIREFYLASLEQISPELRKKFFKLYAYY